MSTVRNTQSSSNHFNEHCFQYLHPFNHNQQMIIQNNKQRATTITNSPDLLSSHFNDDEHCQICGDLASGWHCG